MNDKAILAVSFGTSVSGAEAAIANMEAALRAEGGCPDIERKEGSITIYGDADLNRILRILVNHDLPVRSVNTLEETIEDHYIRLLGRGRMV